MINQKLLIKIIKEEIQKEINVPYEDDNIENQTKDISQQEPYDVENDPMMKLLYFMDIKKLMGGQSAEKFLLSRGVSKDDQDFQEMVNILSKISRNRLYDKR